MNKNQLKELKEEINGKLKVNFMPDVEIVNDDLLVDHWIAWKHSEKNDERYGLRATISLTAGEDKPCFYIMIFSQELTSELESMDDVMKCDLNDPELVRNAYNAIHNLTVRFDTQKYCDELQRFLSEMNKINPIFCKHPQQGVSLCI